MKYCWSATAYAADADKVGRELEIIEERESLTKEAVLKFAKDEKSELHKCFEWDDKIASEKYRLFQASLVLTSISIIYEEEPKRTTRMYVNIKKDDKREYKNIISVLENDDEYKQLLDKAEKDFVSYKEKYQEIVQLTDLKNIIFKNI